MIRKHGGMWFWTAGRFGGTFYRKRRHSGLDAADVVSILVIAGVVATHASLWLVFK